MGKKILKLGMLTAAGAAIITLKKSKKEKLVYSYPQTEVKKSDYKNTELNKQKKNSKGIYYSSGNYEAFARPKKPNDVEKKSACFLIRDAQMPGDHIHILEASDIAGGACDGIADPDRGYIMRGGREMEDHFECLWDLFHSIPSLEHPENSVLDEFYWLNKEDPNYSLCRATKHRGKPSENFGKFNIDDKGRKQIMKLFFTANEKLYDKTIEDVFDEHVFDSDFWLYWRTMFAFENWHSALEMKLYLQRFIHHIGGLPDFSALKFTRYNQYESLILPMVEYLKQNGVIFHFHTQVTNVIFSFENDQKIAKSIEYIKNNETKILPLTKDDLVFVTNGSCTESTLYGKVVTGGIISCEDSNWLLSWTINRQGQFREQKEGEICIWVYSLFCDTPGNYIHKPMKDCTGEEITAEWLYHIGIPLDEIDELARDHANTVPTMLPYITAFFMPRTAGDRPDVIPDGCVNFAFLGQFAETPRDTIFTTEYSVRTAMEAVYGLLGVDRGVPEVWGSVYDVRNLLDASVRLMDGESLLRADLPMPVEKLKRWILKLIKDTDIEKLLKEYKLIKK